jgi:hypothetical protein
MKTLTKIVSVVATCLLSMSTYADGYRVVELSGSPSEEPWLRLITNQSDWENLARESYEASGIDPVIFCSEISYETDCVEPPPFVDFETEQVIVGGFGTRPDDGYDIVVSNVLTSPLSGYQYVTVYETVYGAGCVALPVITNPMIAIVVEKSGLPIKLSFSTATYDCDMVTIDL